MKINAQNTTPVCNNLEKNLFINISVGIGTEK
jgi:hypothetical protein